MNGLSKQKQKYIQSLHNKKYRQQFGVFLVEGKKAIEELLNSDFEIVEAFLSESALKKHSDLKEVVLCNETELSRISTFKSNNYGLIIAQQKTNAPLVLEKDEWILALDDIHDPGNLGTLIRIADWYGIHKIICSLNTVEFYNPKVISASMGSFTRVACYFAELTEALPPINKPIFGAFLTGKNVHFQEFPKSGVLVIGSESHGISSAIQPLIDHEITIPSFGKAESLNAGVATGIILDNLRRNN